MSDPCREAFEGWSVDQYPQVVGVSSGSQMHIDLAKERAYEIWKAAWNTRANTGDWNAMREVIRNLYAPGHPMMTAAADKLTAALPGNQG